MPLKALGLHRGLSAEGFQGVACHHLLSVCRMGTDSCRLNGQTCDHVHSDLTSIFGPATRKRSVPSRMHRTSAAEEWSARTHSSTAANPITMACWPSIAIVRVGCCGGRSLCSSIRDKCIVASTGAERRGYAW